MPLYVYGDVTVDNYEYFGKFSGAYQKIFSDHPKRSADRAPPDMSERANHRIVARALGGSYLLARFAAMALSLWRNDPPFICPDKSKPGTEEEKPRFKRLNELDPWKDQKFGNWNSELTKAPNKFENYLRLHYRLKEASDKCFRVDADGLEGYTLPVVWRPAKKYLHQGKSGEEQDDGITIDGQSKSKLHVMVFNDSGLRYDADPDGWLVKKVREHGADSVWAIVKSREPRTKDSKGENGGKRAAPDFLRYVTQLNTVIPERTIVCLNADDLRSAGVSIGRSLSWDRSLKDLVQRIEDAEILPGHLPGHVVVTFDYDAAAYFKIKRDAEHPKVESGFLIFSKNQSEGEFAAEIDGKMPGSQSLFVSVFSALLSQERQNTPIGADGKRAAPPFEKYVGYSLLAKRRMLECGFESLYNEKIIKLELDDPNKPKDTDRWLIPKIYYQEAVFALTAPKPKKDDAFGTERVPVAFRGAEAERPVFRNPIEGDEKGGQFKKDLSDRGLAVFKFEDDFFAAGDEVDIFQYLARGGPRRLDKFIDDKFVEYVTDDNRDLPICTMGKMKTISSKEIESLRTIRRLVINYLKNIRANEKPIGIAVFGPPGTGKSFAVKTVFETLPKSCKALIDGAFLECNLSGLDRPEDIAEFFQVARDRRLQGKVPVLFFDEFDCSVDNEPFFWLKHFLAPLQDGEFITGHTKRPIGKSIFVFAGGRTAKFLRFQRVVEPEFSDEDDRDNDDLQVDGAEIIKGRDFLSRLQAHINIEALDVDREGREWKEFLKKNPSEEERKEFEAPYTMRKAILLRGLLEQWVREIFSVREGKWHAEIDEDLVRDFLWGWEYKHGVRSMEALIRMSSMGEGGHFSRSSLPPDAQRSMHVKKRATKE